MIRKNYRIRSQEDGLALDVLEILPDGPVHGLVQFSHGMAEHKERYEELMNYLAQHGFACIIHDHRGHGRSVKRPEDRGYFYDQTGEMIVEDVLTVQKHFREEYPDMPLVLFGHSMGSLVVRKFIKKYDHEIQGLIVCGAPWNNRGAAGALVLVHAEAAVIGRKYRSKLLNRLATGTYDRLFEGDDKNRWLSANPANVQAFNDDEACGFVFTVDGFENLFRLVHDVYSLEKWSMHNPRLPIFFIAGSEDPVIGDEQKWKEAQYFLKQRGYRKVAGKLYPGMRHEILNETGKEEVFEDVRLFVESVCIHAA